jgi:signal transduction histidine kinase
MSASDAGMPSANPLAPPANWFEQESVGHIVHFYSEEQNLLSELARFIGTALGAGDSAVVIATEPHLLALEERLAARALDLENSRRQGRYVALPAHDLLSRMLANGHPDADRFNQLIGTAIARAKAAADPPKSRVAVFGEMVALLWAQGQFEAAIAVEKLWNDLAKTHDFCLRCGYPMRFFAKPDDAQRLADVCLQHTAVIPVESYTDLRTDQDRLLNILQLQQKASALETEQAAHKSLAVEIERRRRVEDKLAKLSIRLLQSQDEERRRLARELHDSLGQLLVALRMNLQLADSAKSDPDSAAYRREASSLAERCLKEVRTLSYLLHPPMLDDVGLTTAISWYAGGFSERSGIPVKLDLPATSLRLPTRIELALFRVVQEALTNIHRHSHSATAEIRLVISPTQIQLEIADQGKGIAEILDASAPKSPGIGLTGMRSRIEELDGQLEISSSPQGTRLLATVPFASSDLVA